MEKRSFLLLFVLIALLVFGGLALATQEKADSKIDKEKCLGCHGPYEKIIKATAEWKAPSGETLSPHRYVPHDSQDIPQCTECHTQHEIPLKDKSAVVKPQDVQFCFEGCHHMRNLQPCKNCHS
jgi:hypothetical protein